MPKKEVDEVPEVEQPGDLLALPYKVIDKKQVASRADIRQMKGTVKHARETYMISLFEIKDRDSNARTVYEGLEELADLIDVCGGLLEPVTVDILKDGSITIDHGNRRRRSLLILHKRYCDKGLEDVFMQKYGMVECFVNSSDVTELERIRNQYAANKHSPFTPVGNSNIVKRIKIAYGYTNQKIAEILGMSRQSVDNYEKISHLPDDVKQGIDNGSISLNDALKVVRKIKDSEEQQEEFQHLLSNDGKGRLDRKPNRSGPKPSAISSDKEAKADVLDINPDKDFDLQSEEVKSMNECMGLLDKITVKLEPLAGQHPALMEEISKMIGYVQPKLEEIRNYLTTIQKSL